MPTVFSACCMDTRIHTHTHRIEWRTSLINPLKDIQALCSTHQAKVDFQTRPIIVSTLGLIVGIDLKECLKVMGARADLYISTTVYTPQVCENKLTLI